MITKTKSPPEDSKTEDADAASDEQKQASDDGKKAKSSKLKKAKKAKKSKPKGPSKLKQRLMKFVRALPMIGLVLLLAGAAFIVFEILQKGKDEGAVSYATGRYVVAHIASKKVTGNLLPPANIAPTSLIPDYQPDETNPDLAIPTIAVPDDEVKLRPAPNTALIESKRNRILPKKSADGIEPWQYYARPSTPIAGTKPISVIVTGLGINSDLSLAATKLPPAISLSVSVYAENPSAWVKSLRVQGHECYLDLPVQLSDYPLSDPGPKALQPSITPGENMARLQWLMGQAIGYIGFVVPDDDVFFSAPKDFIEPVATELFDRGISLIFSKVKERPLLTEILEDKELVNMHSQIFIRYGSDAVDVRRQLEAAEAVSKQSGQVLVIIEASPVAIQELDQWSQKIRGRGFQLVPASTLAIDEFS